jgi:hypothetical protein
MPDNDTQSVTSSASVTSNRGVRSHIQKQLAEDIEAAGGIQHFAGHENQNLYHLLQRRVGQDDNPYGERGDAIRTKLRRVVQRWISLDNTDKYISDILNPWQIVQYSARNKVEPPLKPPVQSRHPKSADISSSDSEESDTTTTAAAATPNRRPTSFTKTQRSRPVHQTPPPVHQTPPRQVLVDHTNCQPTTPLTPSLIRGFQAMSVEESNKRKFGEYDWQTISQIASKC